MPWEVNHLACNCAETSDFHCHGNRDVRLGGLGEGVHRRLGCFVRRFISVEPAVAADELKVDVRGDGGGGGDGLPYGVVGVFMVAERAFAEGSEAGLGVGGDEDPFVVENIRVAVDVFQ